MEPHRSLRSDHHDNLMKHLLLINRKSHSLMLRMILTPPMQLLTRRLKPLIALDISLWMVLIP
jgi:hypothetical protein